MQQVTLLLATQVLREHHPQEPLPHHVQVQRVVRTMTVRLLAQQVPQTAELPPRREPARWYRFSGALAQRRPQASWVRTPAAPPQ